MEKPGSLYITTLQLLQEDERTTSCLCQETKLPFHWLEKFRQGKIKNPSVNRIQFLYEFLTKQRYDF